MKYAFVPLLLFALSGHSQQAKDWGAFMRTVNVKDYQGKKFRLEAAVKVSLIDQDADAEIWARIDKQDKTMGFFNNMMNTPIRDSNWKVYTINGKVDKNAENLVFGGLYHRKAIFYFDAFHLYIEKEKNKWDELPMPETDFESDSTTTKKTWNYLVSRKGIVSTVSTAQYYSGKQSFVVDASQFSFEATYGNDPAAGKYADVNGVKIYYETYGQGEPLLLLHGNSCSISLFEKQIPELAKHFRVIAVDTRGQGKSSEDGKTYSYDLFAEDMNALLDQLKIDSINILGWSDGGNTGLIMAMKYPAKVKRLACMGANVFIDESVIDKSVFKTIRKEKKELSKDTSYDARN
ncbi:MAG TPA: alpha/beta hydrolase, partial [Ferruginibacter sp.]|nr:alpha/beta hydrolase [Ferruginibacter sp.]